VQSVASSSEAPSIASAQGGEGTKEGTDGPSEGQSVGNSQRLQVADAAEVKCLLLQAMLDSLPALGIETGPAEDPSPILAAEVLSMPTGTHATSLSQDSLRSNCLKLLSRLSRRAELRRSLEPHVFLIAAGRKLTQLLGGGGRVTRLAATQGAHLLHAVASYLDLVAAPSVAVAVARHCLGPIGFALSALQSSGAKLANWDQASWELLHAVLLVMAPAATHCADADAGRAILTTLLADYKAAVVLTAVGDGILLRAGEGPVRIAYPGRVLALQRDLLGLFSALAGLVGRQPAMPGGASLAGDKGHDVLLVTDDKRSQVGKLTRRQGLNFFASLVAPGNPFLRCVLDNASDALVVAADGSAVPLPPPSSTAVRLRQGLFDLLCAVFSAPGSPYVMDKPTAGK